MQKRGIAYAAFVLLLMTAIALVLKGNITGYQTIDPTTAKMSIQTVLNNIGSSVAGGSVCISVSDPNNPMNYKAVNMGGSWEVTETDQFMCDGENAEDFIIIFPSYNSLSRVLNDPSPRSLAMSAISRDFEIAPSRYMEQGGNVVCDASFKVKYCGALQAMGDNSQLIDADLVCCIDKVSKDERTLLEQHMQEGNYQDETGILEQPAPGLDMGSLILPIILVVVILGGIGAFMVLRKSHKPTISKMGTGASGASPGAIGAGATNAMTAQPGQNAAAQQAFGTTAQPAGMGVVATQQLEDYTIGALSQGYQPEELLQHYIEQGWDQTTAMKVINDAVNRINQS